MMKNTFLFPGIPVFNMKTLSFFGILMVSLVLSNCASTSKKGPSPFEGRWVVDAIEEPGTLIEKGFFPTVLFFRENHVGWAMAFELPDGSYEKPRGWAGGEFTYTDTEIIDSKKKTTVFQYTFDGERLTTIDEMFGKVVWVREDR